MSSAQVWNLQNKHRTALFTAATAAKAEYEKVWLFCLCQVAYFIPLHAQVFGQTLGESSSLEILTLLTSTLHLICRPTLLQISHSYTSRPAVHGQT
jgi:hypothetical protein